MSLLHKLYVLLKETEDKAMLLKDLLSKQKMLVVSDMNDLACIIVQFIKRIAYLYIM